MQVIYGGVTITEGSGRTWSAPIGFVWPTSWLVQVAPLLRGANPKVFDRGNQSNALAFTIAYHGVSVADAFIQIAAWKAGLPRQDDLEIYPRGEGSAVGLVTFHNACLVKCDARHIGSQAICDFEFITEDFEATPLP